MKTSKTFFRICVIILIHQTFKYLKGRLFSADLSLVEKEFHAAVDDYLEFCKEIGKEPDKEYKGTFNVRISPELHKKLVIVAMKNGDTLNATVEKAIRRFVSA